jgi:hypothetical protein
MNAEIHAVDRERPESEGNKLYVREAKIHVVVKPREGLPFGEHRDQIYLEIQGTSWEGTTHSTLTAQLDAAELQRLFEVALEEKMIDAPASPQVVELVNQLQEALALQGGSRKKADG